MARRAVALLRSKDLFRQFMRVYHADGLIFFKLILGMNS